MAPLGPPSCTTVSPGSSSISGRWAERESMSTAAMVVVQPRASRIGAQKCQRSWYGSSRVASGREMVMMEKTRKVTADVTTEAVDETLSCR